MKKIISHIVVLLIGIISLSAQNNNVKTEDRLVRLIKAKTAEMYQSEINNIRRVTGPAQFLHNGALIICDTAIWDVSQNIIDAIGNVKIIQDQTTLAGDRIHYIADSSLAQVRGHLVELTDKDSNILRTHFLDYNTRDSIAYFYNGGSMRGNKDNTIESIKGYFYAKEDIFKFLQKVEMSSDSLMLASDSIKYNTTTNVIEFLGKTNIWHVDGFLSSNYGWYFRDTEEYKFVNNAYIKSSQNEIWADTIFYNKPKLKAELFNNVQITDSVQSVILYSDYANFFDGQVKEANLYKRPTIGYYTLENGVKDTLFFSSDTIKYIAKPYFLIDSTTIKISQKRAIESLRDPINEMFGNKLVPKADSSITEDKTIPDINSSLDNIPIIDSISKSDTIIIAKNDSILIKDTTIVDLNKNQYHRFIKANKNIRFFRKDIQGVCDSLEFNSLDSIIRLYKNPVLWHDKNQFSSDSIQLIISNGSLNKADLLSNAFVLSKEDSIHYNQIKGADVVAYFRDGNLKRFDAYGGVNILFFFEEDSIITTMNSKKCRVMTASINEGKIERIRYFENIDSDAYPVIDLERSKMRLSGFNIRDIERPKSRADIFSRKTKPSRKREIQNIIIPTFRYTQIFFNIAPKIDIFLQ